MAPMSEVGAILLSGGVAAIIAIWAVFTHRAIARRVLTFQHIADSEADRDLIAARKMFIELSREEGGLTKWAEKSAEGTVEQQSVRLVVNWFENIAIGIQRGVIDYKFFRLWFRSATITHWDLASPFVNHLRNRVHNKMLFHEFEEMAKWMNDEKKPTRYWWVGLIK